MLSERAATNGSASRRWSPHNFSAKTSGHYQLYHNLRPQRARSGNARGSQEWRGLENETFGKGRESERKSRFKLKQSNSQPEIREFMGKVSTQVRTPTNEPLNGKLLYGKTTTNDRSRRNESKASDKSLHSPYSRGKALGERYQMYSDVKSLKK